VEKIIIVRAIKNVKVYKQKQPKSWHQSEKAMAQNKEKQK
jgi:hypothetical protein